MEKEVNSGKGNYAIRDILSEPISEDDIENISQVLKRGELIVYPTETLYGLGADPFSETALQKLIEAKKRPENMPISIAVSDMAMMETVSHVNELAKRIYKAFLPGPITILLEIKEHVPKNLTGGGSKVGIRVPNHPVALRLINAIGPITATSANIHDQSEPWDVDTAVRQLGDNVTLYLDSGISKYQAPSTVLDATGPSAKIIRMGVISEDEIQSVLDRK